MTHGDDVGIICPPKLAPVQVVVVPIYKSDAERAAVGAVAEQVVRELKVARLRVELDAREGMKPGAKYYEWEGRGVPLRLEVGPRDVAKGQVFAARRTGGKAPIPLAGLGAGVAKALDEIQAGLYRAALERREASSRRGVSKDELLAMMDGPGGFAYGGFCGAVACEEAIKDATKATVRVLPDEEFRSPTPPATCVWCGSPSVTEAVWAKAY
jgi:prolyl-tRNA synthetase